MMTNLKLEKTRVETHLQLQALAAVWNVEISEAFGRVVKEAAALIASMTPEQVQELNSAKPARYGYGGSDAAKPGWTSLDMTQVPRAEYEAVRRDVKAAFPDLKHYGAYTPVIDRAALRAFLSSGKTIAPVTVGGSKSSAAYSFVGGMPVITSEG